MIYNQIQHNADNEIIGSTEMLKVYQGTRTIIWQRGTPPTPPTPTGEHYGFRIMPNRTIDYLFDASGTSHATIAADGTVDLKGWKHAFFVKNNYPCMLNFDGSEAYKLDPDDHSKKLDGTSSDYNDVNFPGNAMSCFDCHIWMKFYTDGDNNPCFEIADSQLDQEFVDYPYIRADGTHADKMYFPMYPGTIDSNNTLRSIATGYTKYNKYPMETLRTGMAKNGSGWQLNSYAFKVWLNTLLILIFRDRGIVTNYGSMGTAYSTRKRNGAQYNLGQFHLKEDNYTSHTTLKLFYCEWLWSGRGGDRESRELISGLYQKGWAGGTVQQDDLVYTNWMGQLLYKMTPPYSYDGNVSDYTAIDIYGDNLPQRDCRTWSISNDYCFLPDGNGALTLLQQSPFSSTNIYSYSDTYLEPFCLPNHVGANIDFDYEYNVYFYRYYTGSVYYV